MDTATALPPNSDARLGQAVRAQPHRFRPNAVVTLAFFIGFGMSLEFLFQVFVWLNWTIWEVVQGWLYVLRDRLLVTMLMAGAITALQVTRIHSLNLRSMLLAGSVLLGAVGGEMLVGRLYGTSPHFSSLLTHALRWSTVALAVAASYFLWRIAVESRARLLRESLHRQRLEQQLTNTRLTALRKQIEPHFLFNTLATVRRLHQVEPDSGARVLANFINYLSGLLPMLARSEVTLGEELDLVQAYLSVISSRMADRLQFVVDVSASLRPARIPPMALATLVENAIKHGLGPSPSGGEIRIQATNRNGLLEVSVTDTGVGLKPGNVGGSGIGLYNVRARLATLYGPQATVRIQAHQPTGVRASIIVPIQEAA